MKPTHITIFLNEKRIITEISVISQSKIRNITTELFRYMNPDGIGSNKKALQYYMMLTRKNGNWKNENSNHLATCKTYYRNN